jgi:DNA-binding transcriptional ArsR family regulator
MTGLDRTLAALADPTRRGVVELLHEKPCRAGELAESLGLSPPAMSRHLRVLRTSGLVDAPPQGDDARVRVYRLRPGPFSVLRRWLDEVESFWRLELTAFKQHTERTRPGERATDPKGGTKARARALRRVRATAEAKEKAKTDAKQTGRALP